MLSACMQGRPYARAPHGREEVGAGEEEESAAEGDDAKPPVVVASVLPACVHAAGAHLHAMRGGNQHAMRGGNHERGEELPRDDAKGPHVRLVRVRLTEQHLHAVREAIGMQ